MKACFTGTRKYKMNQENTDVMNLIAGLLVSRNLYQTLYFGGALGVDTAMLMNCAKINSFPATAYVKKLIVVVPDSIKHQPSFSRRIIEENADEIIELGNKITRNDGYKSYQIRNEYMVDNSDIVYAFPNKNPLKGEKKGGTWNTINYARKENVEVVINTLE